ncbi:MAG: hypothetical protein A2031_08115 [Deltaproteobacteria bacterium RBG_19FT_COMBO_43_11]|nr:MAG: hypothetical protein A2031_08115 [Deltaproteobacteria bacterium RBG_19FT_COMBO_43_11]
MKAISVQQPWAWALFHGKDVENRPWATKYRGDLLIHASMKFDHSGFTWIMNHQSLCDGIVSPYESHYARGCIVGKVKMVGCVTHHESAWFVGDYAHVYIDPTEFKSPMPYKGSLKFFEVPDGLIFDWGIEER